MIIENKYYLIIKKGMELKEIELENIEIEP